MALQAYAEGRYEEAMQRFSDLLYEDPRNPRLHVWLGASFRKAGKLEYAKVQYQQVLTLTTDADLVSLARSSLAQIQQQSILASNRDGSGDTDTMTTTLQINDTGYQVRRNKREGHLLPSNDPDATVVEHHRADYGSNNRNGAIPPLPVNHQQQAKGRQGHKSRAVKASPEVKEDHVDRDTTVGGRIPPPPGLVTVPPLPPLAVRVKTPSSQGNNGQGSNGLSSAQAQSAHEVDLALVDRVELEANGKSGVASIHTPNDLHDLQDVAISVDQGNSPALVEPAAATQGVEASVARGWGKFALPRLGMHRQDEAKTASHNAKSGTAPQTSVSLAELINRTELTGTEPVTKQRLALEDVINLAGLKSKATLWAMALATVPVVGMGVMTYQMGDRLLKEQVRQTYLYDSQNAAKQVQQFWQGQVGQAKITAQLLSGEAINSSGVAVGKRNVATAPLTNRLRLYHQANPKLDDLFVVQTDGEILGRSGTKASAVVKGSVLMLEPGLLEQASYSNAPMMVMIPKMPLVAIITPIGAGAVPSNGVNATSNTVNNNNSDNAKTGRKNALMVVTIPLNAMQDRLGGLNRGGVHIGDAQGRTLWSNPMVGYAPLVFGSAISNTFPAAGILQTSGQGTDAKFQDDVSLGDKNQGVMAYAPVNLNYASTGVSNTTAADLKWGVFLVGEKDSRSAGVIVLAILVAIGATPVLVGLIAFLLTHQITSRINHIKYRVMSVARTGLEDLLRKQTLLIDETELLEKDAAHPQDEVGALSHSINDMVEQFQILLRKQQRQKQQLQNQVVQLVNELAQLAEVDRNDLLPQEGGITQVMESLKTKLDKQKAQEEKYLQERQTLQQQLTNLAMELSDLQPSGADSTDITAMTGESMHELPEFMHRAIAQLKTVVNQVKQGANQMNQSLGHNELTLAQLITLVGQQAELAQRTVNSTDGLHQDHNGMIRNGQLAVNVSHQIHAEALQNDQAITELITTLQEMYQSMVQTAHTVQNLGNSSQKVNRVLALLNELAVQINFIAINASLEGAKSGNKNNSLIMIAEEIGQMASRSVDIAKEVEGIMQHLKTETTEVMQAVESSREQVVTSSNLLQNTQSSLQELSHLSKNIHELVTAMTETTQSQSKTSESVANLVNNMSQVAHSALQASEQAQHSLQSTAQINSRLQGIFN
ncbi:MAG: methyl-accepting chemotaxis protein [Pseudanabaena sp. ELA607]